MKSDKELASIPRWEERMRFVGRFIAYCLWTGETADLPMLPSVWALLLDKHLHQKDLMLDRPAVCELPQPSPPPASSSDPSAADAAPGPTPARGASGGGRAGSGHRSSRP